MEEDTKGEVVPAYTEMIAKFSVSELYVRHGFVYHQIDQYAGVPAGTTVKMVQDIPVLKEHAVRVLVAISARAQQVYTLENVIVNLDSSEEETP
jgi:hypothetical protein